MIRKKPGVTMGDTVYGTTLIVTKQKNDDRLRIDGKLHSLIVSGCTITIHEGGFILMDSNAKMFISDSKITEE